MVVSATCFGENELWSFISVMGAVAVFWHFLLCPCQWFHQRSNSSVAGCSSRLSIIASALHFSCRNVSSAIKKDPHIDGFVLPDGQCVKLFQYADDTSILVHPDQALLSVFSLFATYEKASGAKLNVGKSHGLLFGSWRACLDLPVPLNWSNVAITVLGCRLGNDAVDWNFVYGSNAS